MLIYLFTFFLVFFSLHPKPALHLRFGQLSYKISFQNGPFWRIVSGILLRLCLYNVEGYFSHYFGPPCHITKACFPFYNYLWCLVVIHSISTLKGSDTIHFSAWMRPPTSSFRPLLISLGHSTEICRKMFTANDLTLSCYWALVRVLQIGVTLPYLVHAHSLVNIETSLLNIFQK